MLFFFEFLSFLILVRVSLNILIGCMTFLPPFLDFIKCQCQQFPGISFFPQSGATCTQCPNKLHDFSVTIPRFYKGVNVNSFLEFPPFLILMGLALIVLIGCMIFLSPFLDFIKVSMSTVSWNFLLFSIWWDLHSMS